jgi:hypothetical protein
MASPVEAIAERYRDVFLSKTKNSNIVSGTDNNGQGTAYSVFTALLDTGSINPVVMAVLVEGNVPQSQAYLKDLDWSSVHVRSYNSWTDLERSGIVLAENNPQKPTVGAFNKMKDQKIVSIAQTPTSKTYHFEDKSMGRLTLFTAKSSINTGGNDLPRTTTMLPCLKDSNFVYEK